MGTRFKALGAVYFVTRRAYDNNTYRRACHDGIYIGHTANLAEAFASHVHAERFMKFGANCVCVLLLLDEERRIAVEQDLLAAHNTHCNHEARAAQIFDVPA